MIAVAMAGLSFGVVVLDGRRVRHEWRTRAEAASELQARQHMKVYEGAIETSAARSVADGYRHWVDVYRKSAEYHAAMKAKYARLARHPWLPVEPDPPEPD